MNDFQNFLDENLGLVQINDIKKEPESGTDYDIYQEIRELIISLRRDNHITQKDLAQRCGMTQANISNLEKGTSKPTIDTLKKISDAFGMRLVIDFVGMEVE